MKISSRKLFPLWAVSAALLSGSSVGLAQPTLTVSPSIISNTYPGFITLTITGVASGETVTVQKWLDGNGNGLIDPGEPMIDAFKITDNNNSNAIIGTITNINVPFDSNAATGAITTTLNCPGALLLDNMVGHYVYQVISTEGQATATFAVTNANLAQSVSGIIYSNDGVTPLPYAVMVAQDQQANNPAGAVVADSAGHYFLTLNPSSYFLIAGMPNYYYNQGLAPSVILTNGMSATNNLTLTNGTATISGNVFDSGNSNGIGGLLVQLQAGKLFAITFTDTNGNYNAAVTSNFWTLQPSKQRLTRRAYVEPEATFQVDASSGTVTNANIALPKGNALFYGRITDTNGAPFVNVEFDGSTGNGITNSFDAKGYSDQNGNYAVAILGDVTNYWSDNANSSKNTALGNYIVNFYNTMTFSPGQTMQENFTALPVTAAISGHVQDNSGTNVVGVGLNAIATINGDNYESLDGTTDNSGNYTLAVASGTWSVQFFTGNFSDSLDNHGYVDLNTPHYVSIPPTNAVLNMVVYPIGTPLIVGPARFSRTQFGFSVEGAVGVNYTVQVSTNLTITNWANLTSFQLTSNFFPVVDTQATNSARFYRVQKN
jgi:hypothetical protein